MNNPLKLDKAIDMLFLFWCYMVYLQNSLTKCVAIKQHTTLIFLIHYGLLIGLSKNMCDGNLLSVLVGWGWSDFFVYYGVWLGKSLKNWGSISLQVIYFQNVHVFFLLLQPMVWLQKYLWTIIIWHLDTYNLGTYCSFCKFENQLVHNHQIEKMFFSLYKHLDK